MTYSVVSLIHDRIVKKFVTTVRQVGRFGTTGQFDEYNVFRTQWNEGLSNLTHLAQRIGIAMQFAPYQAPESGVLASRLGDVAS